MKVGLAGPFGKPGKAGWQRIEVALGRWLLQEMFTKNSCGLVASVLKHDSGCRLHRQIIKYVRWECFCPVFPFLTVSHTAGSPRPCGCCLTFKNHKSLVFLISIACRKSDFYQCVFKLPCIGAIIRSNRKLLLWDHHNEKTCLIQRNLMTYEDPRKG